MFKVKRINGWWWFVIAIVVAVSVCQSTFDTIRWIYERPAEAQATQWIAKAQAAPTATWTEQEAIQWLRGHGYINVTKGEGANGSGEQFYVVQGFREIEKGGTVVRPLSVWIIFYFAMDHRYLRVRADRWPFPCRPLQPPTPIPKEPESP